MISSFFKSLKMAVALGLTSLLLACDASSNRANILPADVQYMADTMFSHRRRAIIDEMDSLCLIQSPELIIEKRDSLVRLERDRINQILGRE